MLHTTLKQDRPFPRVCIVQAVAKQYRLPFFDLLHARLQAEGVALTVLYSSPNQREAMRGDAVDLPAAYGSKVRAYWSNDCRILYQPYGGAVRNADLVIVEQASKHVLNYILHVTRIFGNRRMAYWGHGRNWQQDGAQWLEPLKRAMLGGVDWWFAYTGRVARYVVANGFSADQVTVVQNSVDVTAFRQSVAAFSDVQRLALRQALGIPPEAPVGLFCGSMHAAKKLDFLIESALLIRARIADFHLILTGAGPDEPVARKAAEQHDWIHFTGPLFGLDKAGNFAIADIFLCPGLVGLAILESFAAGLPLFTTNIPLHSPEIDYLTDTVTGVITEFDPACYAGAVASCLNERETLSHMSDAARQASESYGLENMVENFAQGIIACLKKS